MTDKDSIPAKNIEDKIADVVEKALKSFGFVKAERNCFTPKYGDSAYIIEYWDAKKLEYLSAKI